MKHTTRLLASTVMALLLTACGSTPTTEPEIPENRLASQYIRLGVGYMQEGKFEQALIRLQRALELNPRSAEAHDALGVLHERLAQYDEAEENFRKAIQLRPEFSRARTNFGSFLCRRDRVEEAEEQFEAAVANPLYENPEIAYTNAGLCLYQAGDLDKAENYLRRALQINPRVGVALLRMADITYQSSRYLPARAYLQRYTEVGPHTPESLWLGFRIEDELGDRDTASKYAMLLEANFPDSREVRLLQENRQR